MVRPITTKRLLQTVRSGFEQIADHRAANGSISLTDALMSGFGMFSLKDSSLLEFDDRRSKDENSRAIYGLEQVPSDTQMRTILDLVLPEELKPVFKEVNQVMKQNGVLEQMKFVGYYLVSLDGSGYYSSKKVHCANCLERQNSKTGAITYDHQMLAGAIVHPAKETVIPLAPEPIIKQDGERKNDCERNAAKRFMGQLRADHQEVLVNFIEYWEIKGDKVQHFCCASRTDLTVTKINVFELMQGGRARWKIENETFNTLKNQGYNFEHNYGDGQQNLSVNFAMLMMLAFLVDQVQQLAFPLFQAVFKQEGSRKRLWQHLRALFYTLGVASLEDIFSALLYGYKVEGVVIFGPT